MRFDLYVNGCSNWLKSVTQITTGETTKSVNIEPRSGTISAVMSIPKYAKYGTHNVLLVSRHLDRLDVEENPVNCKTPRHKFFSCRKKLICVEFSAAVVKSANRSGCC